MKFARQKFMWKLIENKMIIVMQIPAGDGFSFFVRHHFCLSHLNVLITFKKPDLITLYFILIKWIYSPKVIIFTGLSSFYAVCKNNFAFSQMKAILLDKHVNSFGLCMCVSFSLSLSIYAWPRGTSTQKSMAILSFIQKKICYLLP